MDKWGRHFNGLVRSQILACSTIDCSCIYNTFQERKSTAMLTERSANGGCDAAYRPYVVDVACQRTLSWKNEVRCLLGLTLRFATQIHSSYQIFLFLFCYSINILSQPISDIVAYSRFLNHTFSRSSHFIASHVMS